MSANLLPSGLRNFSEFTMPYILTLVMANFDEDYDDGVLLFCLMRLQITEDEMNMIDIYAMMCESSDASAQEIYELEEYILNMYSLKYNFQIGLKYENYVYPMYEKVLNKMYA